MSMRDKMWDRIREGLGSLWGRNRNRNGHFIACPCRVIARDILALHIESFPMSSYSAQYTVYSPASLESTPAARHWRISCCGSQYHVHITKLGSFWSHNRNRKGLRMAQDTSHMTARGAFKLKLTRLAIRSSDRISNARTFTGARFPNTSMQWRIICCPVVGLFDTETSTGYRIPNTSAYLSKTILGLSFASPNTSQHIVVKHIYIYIYVCVCVHSAMVQHTQNALMY